ncbi:MAG TPA: peroxidase family protein [Gaiellaceae bacterium]|nr:peroxidase family protein [Gaiellaceae bacterium]
MRSLALWAIGLTLFAILLGTGSGAAPLPGGRSLDGSGNNATHPAWGQAGTAYARVAAPSYADGIGQMRSGPSPRYISNRVFNDGGQNLFSENDVSQWGWAWGQFLDHDIGLRDERPAEDASMPFDKHDKLEAFSNDLGTLAFSRSPAAPNTGGTTPRQQINTLSSFIDASNVYGVTPSRLDWLRIGPVDGNPTDNGASLMLTTNGYLPRVGERGDPSTAPPMDLMGALLGAPTKAAVAGDVRANENVALTAIHTLFAREHNRIVTSLAGTPLSDEEKFQIARRVVGAEIQFITYNEFLPSLGVRLAAYRGYSSSVNPALTNEFAVVGYRAHSMIHGEFEPTVPAGKFTDAQLNAFPARGIDVERNADGTVTLVIPLVVAFGNPDLLEQIGEGPILASLSERQYKNDEQIDNSLRSVLFQLPKPNSSDPASCGAPVIKPSCFTGVADLGADDIQRGRDHGMPSYNDLRRAYGLAPVRSFTQITGEATDRFPSDPKIDPNDPVDDPNSLDVMQLRDEAGNVIPLGSEAAQEDAVTATRRTTLAARLRGIYGSVDKVDAFVGMVSEKHVAGTEFGPLQLAIWRKQFAALRDGDRFFYLNDPTLTTIAQTYGITYRYTLADLISVDGGATVPPNVFEAAG